MMFFCDHRDRLGSGARRRELLEEHWSYMDQYTSKLIARGPTYAGDTDPRTWAAGAAERRKLRAGLGQRPRRGLGASRDQFQRSTSW